MPQLNTIRILLAMIALVGLVGGCTSDAEPGPPSDLPSSTDSTAIAARVTGPDGQTFLREITSAAWKDNGRRAGELFAWIPRDAQSTDQEAAIRAGQTAQAIASFIADESQTIADTPANPALWQAFAASLTPYLGAMVGDDHGVAGFTPLDSFDSEMRHTAALFAAMHKDPDANRVFTDAAAQRAHGYEVAFAEAAAANPTLVHSGDVLEDLMQAARLRGLAAAGARLADPESPRPTPFPAQTEAMYQVAKLMVRPGDPHVDSKFFRDGQLLSPDEIPEDNRNSYEIQLTNYLTPWPHIRSAIDVFGRRYNIIAQE